MCMCFRFPLEYLHVRAGMLRGSTVMIILSKENESQSSSLLILAHLFLQDDSRSSRY